MGYLGLSLLKKTAKITSKIPNLDRIKESDFVYLDYKRYKFKDVNKILYANIFLINKLRAFIKNNKGI